MNSRLSEVYWRRLVLASQGLLMFSLCSSSTEQCQDNGNRLNGFISTSKPGLYTATEVLLAAVEKKPCLNSLSEVENAGVDARPEAGCVREGQTLKKLHFVLFYGTSDQGKLRKACVQSSRGSR